MKKKKIYCAFCGTQNDSKKEVCSKCKKSLTPKDHLWTDYFKNHVKDKIKGTVEDNLSSIITNYITSHLYGIAFSILFVATIITGVTSITKNDDSYIKEIEESPVKVIELSLEDEQVKKAEDFLHQNSLRQFPTNFYEGRKITHDDIKEIYGMTVNYLYLSNLQKKEEIEITFNSCEEAKDYPDIYNLCQESDILRTYVIGKGARKYFLLDADEFEKDYQRLYGTDKKLSKENFKVYSIYECNYYEKTNEFICHTLETGGLWIESELTKLVKAEKYNNQMILYEYYINGTQDGTYKDWNCTIKISDKGLFDNEDLIEKGQLYKHTFKNNGNNEYYWYSSEPVTSLED